MLRNEAATLVWWLEASRQSGLVLCSNPHSHRHTALHSQHSPAPSVQARRAVSAMSDTERKLNAKLLREMEAAGAAGGIPAVPGSPVRSP